MEHTKNPSQGTPLPGNEELTTQILEMDGTRLTEYIRSAMLGNPLLEMEPPQQGGRELAKKKMQWLERQTGQEMEIEGRYTGEFSPPDHIDSSAGTLTEFLLRQAEHWEGREDLRKIIRHISRCIDSNGYLDATEPDICEETGCTPEQAALAVAAVQKFAPVGVCARSLTECLTLQLAGEDSLALELARESYAEIAARTPLETLAHRLNVSPDRLGTALARLRTLNPKPGSMFGGSRAPAYIRPDIVVISFGDRYYVMLCEFTYPEIRMNQTYLKMGQERPDPELTAYLEEKTKEIRTLEGCIVHRNKTLLSVARAIVSRQEDFFRYGPHCLRMLCMEEIAAHTGLPVSVIRSIIRNKYVQCSGGIYPLGHFFLRGAPEGVTDENAQSVKWELRRLIEEEDCQNPYSDRQLADLLTAAGTYLSRQTVADYRRELEIPDFLHRRHTHPADGRHCHVHPARE